MTQNDKISDLYFMLMVNDHINQKLHEEIDKRDDKISDLKDEIDSLKTQLEDQRQEITRLRWERL